MIPVFLQKHFSSSILKTALRPTSRPMGADDTSLSKSDQILMQTTYLNIAKICEYLGRYLKSSVQVSDEWNRILSVWIGSLWIFCVTHFIHVQKHVASVVLCDKILTNVLLYNGKSTVYSLPAVYALWLSKQYMQILSSRQKRIFSHLNCSIS
jgi:hypothetical protein